MSMDYYVLDKKIEILMLKYEKEIVEVKSMLGFEIANKKLLFCMMEIFNEKLEKGEVDVKRIGAVLDIKFEDINKVYALIKKGNFNPFMYDFFSELTIKSKFSEKEKLIMLTAIIESKESNEELFKFKIEEIFNDRGIQELKNEIFNHYLKKVFNEQASSVIVRNSITKEKITIAEKFLDEAKTDEKLKRFISGDYAYVIDDGILLSLIDIETGMAISEKKFAKTCFIRETLEVI